MSEQIWRGRPAAVQSERTARELRDFQAHLTAYLLVNLALFLINVATPGSWWFYWPLLGWGAGVLAHAVHVYALPNAPERAVHEHAERDC